MTILKNAVTSIQIGVEDYESSDERRKYSAVRNIYAGLLLLYKEKLRQLSPADDPELLLKRRLKPTRGATGQIVLKADGDQTVDTAEIQERFKEFDVSVTWADFDKIRKLRNALEHYYTNENPDVIMEILAKSCQLIQEFVTKELHLEPNILLGASCWKALLYIDEIYETAKKECASTLHKLNWKHDVIRGGLNDLECPHCNSELIKHIGGGSNYPEIDLTCHSCGKEFTYADIIAEHLDKIYFADNYIAATQGGEYSIDECPECNIEAFLIESNLCLHCDFKYEYKQCEACGCTIEPVSSMSRAICDQCDHMEYMMRHGS